MGGTAINTACSNSTHGWFWSAYTETLNGNKSLLRAFTRQIDDCIKNLPKDYDIKVLLWHQGESDMPHPELYYDNLREVIKYIRQHLVAVTGEKKYARLPVICGTYAKNSRQRSPKIVEALYLLANDDPNFYVVEAEDLTLLDDNLHFDAHGAETLGQRVFDKLMHLCK